MKIMENPFLAVGKQRTPLRKKLLGYLKCRSCCDATFLPNKKPGAVDVLFRSGFLNAYF
jgi:hypothetical protein